MIEFVVGFVVGGFIIGAIIGARSRTAYDRGMTDTLNRVYGKFR